MTSIQIVMRQNGGRAMSSGSNVLPYQCTRSTNGGGGQIGYSKLVGSAMTRLSRSTTYVTNVRFTTKKTMNIRSALRSRRGTLFMRPIVAVSTSQRNGPPNPMCALDRPGTATTGHLPLSRRGKRQVPGSCHVTTRYNMDTCTWLV